MLNERQLASARTRLLMAIEPLCLLRKRCPVAAQFLIGKLDERVSCLLRTFSRTICFAPVLVCSSSHAQPTSVRALPFPPRSGQMEEGEWALAYHRFGAHRATACAGRKKEARCCSSGLREVSSRKTPIHTVRGNALTGLAVPLLTTTHKKRGPRGQGSGPPWQGKPGGVSLCG